MIKNIPKYIYILSLLSALSLLFLQAFSSMRDPLFVTEGTIFFPMGTPNPDYITKIDHKLDVVTYKPPSKIKKTFTRFSRIKTYPKITYTCAYATLKTFLSHAWDDASSRKNK